MNIVIHPQLHGYLNSLDEPTRVETRHLISLLREYGHQLRLPHSRALGRGLFELRGRAKSQVRIYYCYQDQFAVLLNVHIKKTQKIPNHIIKLARSRLQSLT